MYHEVFLQLAEKAMCLVFSNHLWPRVCFFCSHRGRSCCHSLVDRTNLLARLFYTFTSSTGTLSNMNVVCCLTLPDARQDISWLSVSSLARLF